MRGCLGSARRAVPGQAGGASRPDSVTELQSLAVPYLQSISTRVAIRRTAFAKRKPRSASVLSNRVRSFPLRSADSSQACSIANATRRPTRALARNSSSRSCPEPPSPTARNPKECSHDRGPAGLLHSCGEEAFELRCTRQERRVTIRTCR